MELELGQLVRSMAGRDRGRVFVVVEKVGDGYCRVADGRLRRMDHPKLKNCKHLQAYRMVNQSIARAFRTGRRPDDSELVAAIKEVE